MDNDDRFTALAAEVHRTVRVAPPHLVRARGDQRRRAGLTVVAAAATVTAVASGMAFSIGSAPGPQQPAAPTVDATATGQAPQTKIPAAMRLSHDGEPGWNLNTDPAVPSGLTVCPGYVGSDPAQGAAAGPAVLDPTAVDRTDALTATGPATPLEAGTPTATQTEQLFLFSDEKAATKAMRAMRLMPHCGLLMAPIGLGYPDRDALGYDGFLGADGKSVERADQAVRSVKMTLIRRGNAIWLRSTQMSGIGYGGYTTGAVDVPTELCSVLGLCQPSGTPPS